MAVFWLGAFLVWIFGSHWTGTIAQEKGYSYWAWTVRAMLLMIVALPVALCMKPSDTVSRLCPHCQSRVPRAATVCARCSRDMEPATSW